jgi:hypothetical protein
MIDVAEPQETLQTRPLPAATGPARHMPLPLLPLAPGVKAKPNTPARTQRDLRTLVAFVHTYCKRNHQDLPRQEMKSFNVPELSRKPVCLCADCTKLLQHAIVKRTHCPRDPKPDCKHCPTHCYAPEYRAKIRKVMMFSGRYLVMRGRLDYLWHLFF